MQMHTVKSQDVNQCQQSPDLSHLISRASLKVLGSITAPFISVVVSLINRC